MIYDCFTFFNELELLELRLHELAPVVDRFVLVEATRTFSNQPKPLFFADNKSRFQEFLPKIIHVVVDDFPAMPDNRWFLEFHQRDAIARGLINCRPDDVIIVSDVDEIIRPQAILDYKDVPGIKFFQQRLYYYFLNCECRNTNWTAAKMVFYRDLHSPQWLRWYPRSAPFWPNWRKNLAKRWMRIKRATVGPKDVQIENGGWHFSFLGGIESIQNKIKAFSHSEYDKEEFLQTERLIEAIESGNDLFGRKNMFEFVPIDESFPSYIRANAERFRSLIRLPA